VVGLDGDWKRAAGFMQPSAESWTVSEDLRVYEFKLRQGLKFHNGDPFTAEDVQFSFWRYKSKILREKVREVEIVDPHRVRFHLHGVGPRVEESGLWLIKPYPWSAPLEDVRLKQG
jgi:ABC-type transport system substrate-binding protein